jgi:hypothetical protein
VFGRRKGHTSDVPILMMFSNKDIEPVEDYDHHEVEEGEPSGIWLKLALEDKSVAVHPLNFECLVKLEVCNAN